MEAFTLVMFPKLSFPTDICDSIQWDSIGEQSGLSPGWFQLAQQTAVESDHKPGRTGHVLTQHY